MGDLLEEGTAILEGFNSYFSHSRARTGYSGVATYCMDNAIPLTAEEGLSGLLANQAVPVPHWLAEEFSEQELRELDNEGRALITKHRIRLADGREEMLAVINVYCPRADPESEHRCRFKLRFYQLLQAKAQALLRHGENVLILGDLNTAHRPIDHCEPGDLEQFCAQPGRLWMDGFVSYALGEEKEWGGGGGLFVDAFRLFHPSQRDAYTCWCVNTGARQTNYGTRIDYILASHALALGVLRDCILLPEVQGSDHCPVKAWLRADCLPADRCPPLCTRYMPEFAGVQQKLSRFLVAQPSHCPASPEVLPAKVAKPQRQVGRGKRGKGRPIPNGSLLAFFKPVTSCKPSTPTPSPPLGGEVNSSPGRQKEAPIDFWKGLLKGRPLPPHCSRHQEPCILRTVKKAGPNQGRDFYACQRPKGAPHNPASRCDFFRWADTSS
ncbi:DNA-(apurinic or apyrimidinic site) endonuclease 2 isoform X1 [Narcine bancroftii]|uniref:DNA-(apurinic or apyrimidinic site) endonuclease 2 isoform X1 n=1 Tax=Narcine bancroftii TaxID=1343680 RepID=UPI003831FC13